MPMWTHAVVGRGRRIMSQTGSYTPFRRAQHPGAASISAALSHMLPGMEVDTRSGALTGARQIASPNCDARPPGVAADLIVVHGISLPPGEFGGPWIDRLFTNL